jgi:hypothetical protein
MKKRRTQRIKFTWGGGKTYTVYLQFVPGLSTAYEPIVYEVPSCYEAQQVAQRFNAALKRWAPELLEDDAELPGVGFQYSKPLPSAPSSETPATAPPKPKPDRL